MRSLASFVFLAIIAYGAYWIWDNDVQLDELIHRYSNNQILTLEARYTAEQIMDAHKHELLGNGQRTYQEASLKFYPYLLMEVKYSLPNQRTKEGVILWGMEDGEMVLNTLTWEKTHGFDDAIYANATREDFRIINALAKHNGSMTRQELLDYLRLESDIVDEWIESAKRKALIVQRGISYYLHFENPKLNISPQTKINQWLVTKPYNHAMRIPKKYTKKQIERVVKAAFGGDFTIRSSKEVFLPVYSIEVLNPDGSLLTSYWNALNGKRMHPKYLH